MKNWLSRYNRHYPATLVYMLQAGEYDVWEYLRWFHRTRNFNQVAKRGKLDPTPKARLLLGALLAENLIATLIVVWLVFMSTPRLALLIAVLAVIISPFFLAYSLALPLVLGRLFIQLPRERAIVRSTRRKLAAHPATKIAIAGSYGKTTMKDLLATVLKEGKIVAATPGNYNTPLGISRFVNDLVGDEEVLIFEMGEYYPGDIEELSHMVQPDIGIITGVNEAHLSKFKSLEKTARTIFELAEWLQLHPTSDQVSEGPETLHQRLYANGENQLVAMRADQYGAIMYTRQGVGDWKVTNAKTGLEGTLFTLKRGNESLKVASKLLGLHQVGPLSVVAAVAEQLELSPQQIETGLAETKPFEHRLEPKLENDVWTVDDTYNGNPDGVKAAIDFLGQVKAPKRYYVTPGLVEMGHRTREVHEQIGAWLAEAGIEVIVLIETSVMQHIQNGLKAAGYKGKLLTYPDEITALLALPNMTTAGDVVLLQNDWPDNFA